MSGPNPNQLGQAPLEYAPRPRFNWISRHRRSLISLAILLAVAGSIWWNWQPLKRRVLWLYWFHQAAANVMPTPDDTVIADPRAVNIPTTRPSYVLYVQSPPRNPPAVSYQPTAYRELQKLDGRLQPLVGWGNPVIFMGTLRRPDGVPRLVTIAGTGDSDSGQMLFDTRVAILPMPGIRDPIPQSGGNQRGRGPDSYTSEFGASYRTATIDPKDPSHIVVQYSFHVNFLGMVFPRQKPLAVPPGGELDGFLQNDDRLRFMLRGPGKLAVNAIGTTTAPALPVFPLINIEF